MLNTNIELPFFSKYQISPNKWQIVVLLTLHSTRYIQHKEEEGEEYCLVTHCLVLSKCAGEETATSPSSSPDQQAGHWAGGGDLIENNSKREMFVSMVWPFLLSCLKYVSRLADCEDVARPPGVTESDVPTWQMIRTKHRIQHTLTRVSTLEVDLTSGIVLGGDEEGNINILRAWSQLGNIQKIITITLLHSNFAVLQ